MAEPHSVLPSLPKRGDIGSFDNKDPCWGGWDTSKLVLTRMRFRELS